MESTDLTDFSRYTERFSRLVGALAAGQYGSFRGRLVRRLDAAAYEAKITEYLRLGHRLSAAVCAGDTIDDALALELRAAEVDLVLEESQFLPEPRRARP